MSHALHLANKVLNGTQTALRGYDFDFDGIDVCLGGNFTGGRLVFIGPGGVTDCKIDHKVGTAVLHPGEYMHQAQNTKTGERTNLILWCRK